MIVSVVCPYFEQKGFQFQKLSIVHQFFVASKSNPGQAWMHSTERRALLCWHMSKVGQIQEVLGHHYVLILERTAAANSDFRYSPKPTHEFQLTLRVTATV
jgi:hypothetical protein